MRGLWLTVMTQRNTQVAGEISSLREQQLQCNQRFPIMSRFSPHQSANSCDQNGEQFTNTHNVHTQGQGVRWPCQGLQPITNEWKTPWPARMSYLVKSCHTEPRAQFLMNDTFLLKVDRVNQEGKRRFRVSEVERPHM